MNLSQLNLAHLKYFVDAAETGSVTRAAELNHVTHSAVSQAIRRLEENLSLRLLAHQKRAFELTLEGKAFLHSCGDILASLQTLKHRSEKISGEPSGEITIGSSHSIIAAYLLPLIKAARKSFPNLTIRLKLGKTPYVRGWLDDRSIDLGITLDDGMTSDRATRLLRRGSFVLAQAKQAPKFPIPEGKLVVTENRPEVAALRSLYLGRTGSPLPVTMEIDSWNLIMDMVESEGYVGLVPDFVALASSRDIRIYKPSRMYQYDMVAMKRRSMEFSPHETTILEMLQARAEAG